MKIPFFFLFFIFSFNMLFAREIILHDSNIKKNIGGKVIIIHGDEITILNPLNKKIKVYTVKNSNKVAIKVGDSVRIISKKKKQKRKRFMGGCCNIRERIRKLAEKRRNIKHNRRSLRGSRFRKK